MHLPTTWIAWTPTLNFGGSSTGITYTFRSGFYYQIGGAYVVQCYILLSSKGSATGNVGINFPFTFLQSGGTPYNNTAICQANNFPTTTNNIMQFFGTSGTNTGSFSYYSAAGAVTVLTNTDFNNTSSIIFSKTFYQLG